MNTMKLMVTSVALSGLLLSGCIDADGTYNNTANGAAIGATVGGLIGRAVADDDNKNRGTVVGAAVGGVIGGVVGNDLEKQEAELRGSLNGTGAQIINQGDRLVVSLPESITFPVNSTEVKSSLYPALQDIAASMNNYPNTTIQIVGHTDSTGSDAYNLDLSQRRASAVANILRSNGVSSGRLTIVGMGERAPIADNSTEAGKQANRRVEINIYPIQ